MRIALALKWPLNSIASKGNVVGDELYARALADALLRTGRISACSLSAPGSPIGGHVDAIVYFNDFPTDSRHSRRHILYMQNGYGEGSYQRLEAIRARGYDGYAFISRTLLDKHVEDGFEGIWMPFGVDTTHFYPRHSESHFRHEVAYIGNDIKGTERTMRYLYPALRFDFGLYGNWPPPSLAQRLLNLTGIRKRHAYKDRFSEISRGKISQKDVPTLYSSAKININCTIQDCVDWDVLTLRNLEVLACGGFLLTDSIPSLKLLLGSAAVATEGGSDLVDKIEYYLSNENERMELAEQGPPLASRFSLAATAFRLAEYIEEVTS